MEVEVADETPILGARRSGMEVVVELPASRLREPEGLAGSESLRSVAIEPSGSSPSLPLSIDISP